MTALRASIPSHPTEKWILERVARFPGLRGLAWAGDRIPPVAPTGSQTADNPLLNAVQSGDVLYASAGYQLLCAKVTNISAGLSWLPVGRFRPELRRQITVRNRVTARLWRDGFHALTVLPAGSSGPGSSDSRSLVAAVAGGIVTLRPGESEFRVTHAITRGTRPLHIACVPDGRVYWGEYFDNAGREEVHVYGSSDGGESWGVAYTFPRGAIRHVHNIVHDPWERCLWILTGDYGEECRILRATYDLSGVETVLQGNQQARAVALVPMPDGLYFSSDTPLETNYVYRLDRQGRLARLTELSSSSIYGCSVGDRVFFSTMVEPSEVNRDRHVRIFGGRGSEDWKSLLAWPKDRWSMRFFQYGNAFLPDGVNSTPYLALSTIAVEQDDMTMSLYRVGGS
jgi:hypothetical protein